MEETKIWKVDNAHLVELNKGKLDLEERIHDWIKKDIKIILPDAILIGSKIKTDHDKEVDLLAIDSSGDLIIIELKRQATTRDVIGQTLDYAAWAATLKVEDINQILQKQGLKETIYEILNKTFEDAEDIEINENQKLLVVASEIDATTERIINFLSDKGVNINAITFNYYKSGSDEFIARNILIQREETYSNENKKSGRFVTKLFNENKIAVGQVVEYIPLSRNNSISNKAEIVRVGSKCLKISGSDEKFSFSGLRKKFILDNQLKDLNPFFPYNQWSEWAVCENGTSKLLSEL